MMRRSHSVTMHRVLITNPHNSSHKTAHLLRMEQQQPAHGLGSPAAAADQQQQAVGVAVQRLGRQQAEGLQGGREQPAGGASAWQAGCLCPPQTRRLPAAPSEWGCAAPGCSTWLGELLLQRSRHLAAQLAEQLHRQIGQASTGRRQDQVTLR